MGMFDFVKRGGTKTIYLSGSIESDKFPSHVENYREVLKKLGISEGNIPVEIDSGVNLYTLGYRKDARSLAIENYDSFKLYGVQKIITSSAVDYWMYSQVYPTFIQGFDIEVEHIFVSILGGIKSKGIRFNGSTETREKVTYQDPCFLSRRCGIFNEPREIIESLGGKIIEMKNNKEDVLCCGASGGVLENEPELAKSAAKILSFGIPRDSTKFICGSGLCFANLVNVESRSTDFSIFVLGKLRGMGV